MKRKMYEAFIELEYATEASPVAKKTETITESGNFAYEVKQFAFEDATKKLIEDKAVGDIYVNYRLERFGEYVEGDEDYFKLVNGQLEMM